MKYGLLINETNQNIGDDIQAYAEAQFLPRVDLMVDREYLSSFKYGDGTEPVALIMGAWFMWRKWNWPPARQIVPLNVGYHHFDRNADLLKSKKSTVAITNEHYTGAGGQWLRDYGPVGCRDLYTCRVFDEVGIPNYFSGCVTLTLPKQPETPDKGTYIVCVDLNEEVERKVVELTQGAVEVRKVTHSTSDIKGATWEERKSRVEEYLTLYQNARYVVTRRLHVALPCLAMGVPVMVIQSIRMNDPNRFEPYKKWLHYCRNVTFLEKGYAGFDFVNGTPNKNKHLRYREKLIESITSFVDYCEQNADKGLDFFDKTSYTEEELLRWRVELMQGALARTHAEQKELHEAYCQLKSGKGGGGADEGAGSRSKVKRTSDALRGMRNKLSRVCDSKAYAVAKANAHKFAVAAAVPVVAAGALVVVRGKRARKR